MAAHEVHLDEEEDDDSFTRCRLGPWYRFGKFEHERIEEAYRVWHHRLWIPRVKVMFLLSSIVYFGGFIFTFLVTKDSIRRVVADVFPHTLTTFTTTAFIARLCPLVMAATVIFPASRKLVTPKLYQRVVALSYIVPLLADQLYPSIALNPGLFVPDGDAAADFYNVSTPRSEEWYGSPRAPDVHPSSPFTHL